MVYKTGDAVISKAGHDKGSIYIVLDAENDMLMLANGKTRAIDSPKLKKQKHTEYIGSVDESSVAELKSRTGRFLKEAGTGDSELRRLLKSFENNDSEKYER